MDHFTSTSDTEHCAFIIIDALDEASPGIRTEEAETRYCILIHKELAKL